VRFGAFRESRTRAGAKTVEARAATGWCVSSGGATTAVTPHVAHHQLLVCVARALRGCAARGRVRRAASLLGVQAAVSAKRAHLKLQEGSPRELTREWMGFLPREQEQCGDVRTGRRGCGQRRCGPQLVARGSGGSCPQLICWKEVASLESSSRAVLTSPCHWRDARAV